MAMTPADAIKNIKNAREPIGFGFGVGDKPASHVLIVDKTKHGDALAALAKKEPGVKASCGGTVVWSGSKAVFASERPVPNLDNMIDQWVKAGKVSLSYDVLAGKAEIEKAEKAEAAKAEKDKGPEKPKQDKKSPFSKEQVVRRLKQAKTKDMHFAFGLSPDPKSKPHALILHPIKTGDKLFRLAKKANGAVRKCWGMVTLEGALAIFTCEEKPIPGLKRSIKALFKGWKLPFRVQIMGPEGEDLDPNERDEEMTGEELAALAAFENAPEEPDDEDDDLEDVPEEEEPETETAEPVDPRAIEALRAELARLLPRLQNIAKGAPIYTAPVRDTYQNCTHALDAGDLQSAQSLFAELGVIAEEGDALLAALATAHQTLEALLPQLKPIVANDKERGPEVRENYAACDKALKAGELDEGQRLLALLQGVVGGSSAGGSIIDRWRAAREAWNGALELTDQQISALQAELKKTDDEDLHAIAEFGLNAITGNFKVRLMAAMMELDRADDAGFKRAAPKALGLVQGFQKHIGSDPRVEAVDENPFGVRMTLRQTLGGALSGMENVLQAA
jgi:hypothetical protein